MIDLTQRDGECDLPEQPRTFAIAHTRDAFRTEDLFRAGTARRSDDGRGSFSGVLDETNAIGRKGGAVRSMCAGATLFGRHVLVRRWGRIGTAGKIRLKSQNSTAKPIRNLSDTLKAMEVTYVG